MSGIPGEVLASISKEMVRLKATYYGKGPVEAKTYQCDDFIFSVLKGAMTPPERVLVERGSKKLVQEFRLAFQDKMTDEFVGAVERLTGRSVLTYDSQILFDPDVVIEIFLLSKNSD